MGWLCCCAGIVWEPIRKRAHMHLIREHSTTVISACWATVYWSWPKEWYYCVQPNFDQKQNKKSTGEEWITEHSPKITRHEEKATTTTLWAVVLCQIDPLTTSFLHPWLNEVGVGCLCCPSKCGNLPRKWAHKQLGKEHRATVVWAHWPTVNWSWLKKWSWCAQADLCNNNRKAHDLVMFR